jgi:hypothetical protein
MSALVPQLRCTSEKCMCISRYIVSIGENGVLDAVVALDAVA